MVLNRGGREIDLLFLGRGHTGGDTVVFLPKERIVCTGDLMESRLAYMGDAFFSEWITTLEELKKLDFAVDLPGHGVPFTNKSLITAYQAYLSDLINQVPAIHVVGPAGADQVRTLRHELCRYAILVNACTGGRIRHHLQHNLGREESSINTVGKKSTFDTDHDCARGKDRRGRL
jgi:glyoxylase-like metal-dependent hydrolase (beta-lactamase superfamily II)